MKMLKDKATQKCKTESRPVTNFYNHLPFSFCKLQHIYNSTFHSYTAVGEEDQDETYSRVSTLATNLFLFIVRYIFLMNHRL